MDGRTQLLTRGSDSSLHARQRRRRDDEAWQLSVDIDIELARNTAVNVLIVGPASVAAALVSRLLPRAHNETAPGEAGSGEVSREVASPEVASPEVIVRCDGDLLSLPPASGEPATLVIRDVDALSSGEQYRLLRWLDAAAERGPIVSTAAAPLLPLVEAGMFSEALFYRLNTIYIDLFE